MIEQGRQVCLRPLDVVILLKRITPAGSRMNGKQLAASLVVSEAVVSIAMDRCRMAGLVDAEKKRVNVLALRDFLVYGIRYCFPAQPGGLSRGVPTASSAQPLNRTLSSNSEGFVWKDPKGSERGQTIVPLYENVSAAIKNDADFYALLAIVDSLRIGKTREREAAADELEKYINRYAVTE
jgi:hypothetical protein